MTAQYELDRTLGAWFGTEAASAPPAEPLLHILATTRIRRPRPSRIAGIGGHWIDGWPSKGTHEGTTRLRPALVIAVVAMLVAGIVGSALLVGNWLRTPAPRIPHVYLNELARLPDLPAPKAVPMLVPLADGRVLIIGTGGDGGDQATTAVLYDAATGQSEPTGPLVEGSRLNIAATAVLPDGRVLLIGEAYPPAAPESMVTQVFDPGSATFSEAAPAIVPRAGGTLTSLRDGRVLLVGGTPLDDLNTAIAEAELFDPAANSFTSTGSLGVARSRHTTELLGDGTVLVYGGMPTYTDGSLSPLPAERFDPATGTFAIVPGSPSPPGKSAAVHLPGGELVFVQNEPGLMGRNSDSARWDAASGQLMVIPSPSSHVWRAAGLDNGFVLVAGGQANAKWLGIWGPPNPIVRQVATSAGFAPSLVRLADGRVLVVGGVEDADIHAGSMAPAIATVQIFQ